MTSIIVLAISSMAASLYIASSIQNQASVINISGTLRMRAYRLASSLVYQSPDEQHWQKTRDLIKEFEKNLQNPELIHVLPGNQQHPLQLSHHLINQQWQEEILPLFEIYLDGIDENSSDQSSPISEDAVINLRNRYFQVVLDFVQNINQLVNLLENDLESRARELRVYLFFALSLTLVLITTALVLVYRRVHCPVQQLLKGARLVRKRDFSYRTNYTSHDEPGQLCLAFNSMADDLSKVYDELEDRVQQQTADLKRSKQSIELLYSVVKRLNETVFPQTTFISILKDIEKLLSTGRGTICINARTQNTLPLIEPSLDTTEINPRLCENLQKHLEKSKSQFIKLQGNTGDTMWAFCVPVRNQNQQYGALIIECLNNQSILPWQQQLLESIAGHIATAIHLSHQTTEIHRLALIEERGVIARELHDSLAQSLTFMKIQVSRLQAILKNTPANSAAEDVILELKEGLNSAYRELRELLTTFRLRIDGNNFNDALEKTVAEFNDRSETRIESTNQLNNNSLTPNEEIHILQIIREALSNIVQHANASTAQLTLQYALYGDIKLIIKDNGSGLSAKARASHHYGLSIMRERARTLNATFDISSATHSGTRIELCFSPTHATVTPPINRQENT